MKISMARWMAARARAVALIFLCFMPSVPRAAISAAVLALTACGDDTPTAQPPVPVMDQAFEPGVANTSGGFQNVGARAQTFTVGITGTLHSVDLILTSGGGDDVIRVDLRETTGGGPNLNDSLVLGSRLVAADSLIGSSNTSFVKVNFASDGIPVVAGQSLAIVLIRVTGVGGSDILWVGENSGTENYAGGTQHQRSGGNGTAWTAIMQDFYFRTWVLP